MKELGSYPLPNGWRWATIPELVGDDGVFIDGDWVESKDQDPKGDVRLIQLADVGDGTYRDRSSRFLTREKAVELGCTFLKGGDVLIARMPDPLGRACIFPGDEKPSVTVVDVCIVRSANGEFDHRWLSWFVNASPVRAAISGLQAGSTRKRISRGNLATIPLPVPPLKEQRRIVAEIEKQFTRLDAGVAALRRVQANLKRYRAAVLKAACEGRLVPTEADVARKEGRTFETGEQLLQRILTDRRKSWTGRGKYKEPLTPSATNKTTPPEGWAMATLEQLCPLFADSAHRTPKYGPEGCPALGPRDVVGGRLNLKSARLVDDSEFAIQTQRHVPQAGDVVYSRELSLGWGAVIPQGARVCLSQGMCVFRPHADVELRYFVALLNGPVGRKYAEAAATGSAHPHINLGDIKAYVFPLPPFAEQKRIVAEVERRLSVIDELETVVTANLARATRLRQSVLHQAFSGRLVS